MGVKDSKVKPLELEDAVQIFYRKLKEALEKHQSMVELFLNSYKTWDEKRSEVIQSLSELVTELQKHHRNVNIASLTGSSVSFLSGVACIAGLVLAPVTAGMSTLLSVGGLLGSSAGTLTMAGAKVVEFGLKMDLLKKASAAVEEDCQETISLASCIDNCQKSEEEIQSLLQDDQCMSYICENSDFLENILTKPEAKASLDRVKRGGTSVNDYMTLLAYCQKENNDLLKRLNQIKSVKFDGSIISKTQRIVVSLKGSVTNIKQCLIMLRNWKNGLTTVRTASKVSRLSKGALVGVSMAVDVYDIGTTAKEMILKQEPEDIENLRKIVDELQQQKDEVSEYFEVLSEPFEPA